MKSTSYKPIILKKFAYLGVYFGIDDYFSYRMIETLPSYENNINEEYSYPYNWNDRISIKNNKKNYPLAFWKSPIFKALLRHKSQKAYLHYVGICNSDIIYWYRSTESLTYDARIEASSGDVSYLNDFKIVDTDNILSKNIVIEPSLTKAWIPSKEDKKHHIKYIFPERRNLSFLLIYQAPFSHISQIKISIDNGEKFIIDCQDTNIIKIEIPIQYAIQYIDLFFITNLNTNIIIYEIEIYKEQPQIPWGSVPFKEYDPSSIVSRNKHLLSFYSYMFELHHIYRNSILKTLRTYWWRLDYKINEIFDK